MVLRSYISEHGLHGTITFTKVSDGIKITTDLSVTLQYPNQAWSWTINQFPIDYTNLENRCDDSKTGKALINLDDIYGYLILPDNMTSELITQDLKVNGDGGLYGKSIVLQNLDTNTKICASIVMLNKNDEKTAIARFNSPISGNVYFRWFSTKDNHSDMLITTDLYHVGKINDTKQYSEHVWKIYVTDILDSRNDKSEIDCNVLQLVFDPESKGNGKAIGDIDARLGKVRIAMDYTRNRYKTLFRDQELILLPSDLTGPQRRLYLVIFESKHEDSFMACAKIRYDHPITSR